MVRGSAVQQRAGNPPPHHRYRGRPVISIDHTTTQRADGTHRATSITISIDDIDDPRGDIAGTVAAGRTRLAAALTLLGEADMPAIADDDELWHLLSGAGALSQTLAGRV